MTILAIDYGEKRIGLAVTDELEIIASPLETVANDPAGLGRIRKVVVDRRVDTVVVGLPLNMNGTAGPAAHKALEFARSLQTAIAAAVVTYDERLTTVQAERSMLERDMSRARRRKRIDQMAAQVLLSDFLESGKRGNPL